MKTFIKLQVSILLFICLSDVNTKAQCHIDDWTALKALYESTDGDNWEDNKDWDEVTNNNPTSNCDLDDLHGVSVDEEGRVDKLSLTSNQLNGNIPPELGYLSNLIELDLDDNDLSSSIPPELGNLGNLTELDLDNNELNGSIPPELGNLNNLIFLDLDNNLLSNNIPIELGNLSNLAELDLKYNELDGNIPPQFENLGLLTLLEVSNNNLSGCYFSNLINLCTQLNHPNFDGNSDISNGNNFDVNWEDFCINGTIGTCIDVFPGDINHDGIVNNQDLGLLGLNQYEVGPPRIISHQNSDWYPHPAENWNRLQINNEDIKHFDCDGNGVVDEDDREAVVNNMGESWMTAGIIEMPDSLGETDYQVILHPINQILEDILVLNISFERRTSGNLSVTGGYLTIDYSNIQENIDYATLGLSSESWLGNRGDDLIYDIKELPIEKKIELGFTKSNNENSVGSGVIGQLILAFDNSNAREAKKNNMYEFKVNNIGVHNSVAITPVEDQLLQVNVDNSNYCQTNWLIDENTPFQNQYKSNETIVTNGLVIIGDEQEVVYQASNITLNNGFSAKAGADFKIRVGGCAN